MPAKSNPEPKYVIGIDLGTTNSEIAFAEIVANPDPFAPANVQVLAIPQLAEPGEVREETVLPSFLYLPGAADFPPGSTALPWNDNPPSVVGRLAQKRGADNAGRLVSSAKSWLSHSGVDRTSPLLPFRAPEGVDKISPVEASRRYLEHIRDAWNHTHSAAPFKNQQIVVTVPASFDAVARELTLDAARQAGYPDITLLEEPQAAFYSWIERHPNWRELVTVGDLILVVDIGGGTTDFTLIAVTEESGSLSLVRAAVGEHILLGGDNIDLALAGAVSQRLAEKGTRIDSRQLQALWNNCRAAKEKLLDPASKVNEVPVTIAGRGTGLVGGTIKASLLRSDIESVLTAGFLPETASTDLPALQRRTGVQELGLPYAADAAITRHLARFLRQQAAASEHGAVRRGPTGLACPTHVLFNGGVLHATLVRDRLLSTLNSWIAAEGFEPVKLLTGEDLTHAVARGAAYHALARRGSGVRVRGGVARTYYIGVESAMPSIPGFPAPLKALAVVPFGMEEGTDARVPGREFGLIVGQPAEFRFFTSASRKNDKPGDLIEDISDELTELAPMEAAFDAGEKSAEVVPVAFESVVTDTGLLQLWCVARDGRRWKLEFNVRERVQ